MIKFVHWTTSYKYEVERELKKYCFYYINIYIKILTHTISKEVILSRFIKWSVSLLVDFRFKFSEQAVTSYPRLVDFYRKITHYKTFTNTQKLFQVEGYILCNFVEWFRPIMSSFRFACKHQTKQTALCSMRTMCQRKEYHYFLVKFGGLFFTLYIRCAINKMDFKLIWSLGNCS